MRLPRQKSQYLVKGSELAIIKIVLHHKGLNFEVVWEKILEQLFPSIFHLVINQEGRVEEQYQKGDTIGVIATILFDMNLQDWYIITN